jgi:hypothetical protein
VVAEPAADCERPWHLQMELREGVSQAEDQRARRMAHGCRAIYSVPALSAGGYLVKMEPGSSGGGDGWFVAEAARIKVKVTGPEAYRWSSVSLAAREQTGDCVSSYNQAKVAEAAAFKEGVNGSVAFWKVEHFHA